MDDRSDIGHVARLVRVCADHRDHQQKGRETALEYYRGEMLDLPSKAGKSSVTSQDVRAAIKKLMPSITRTILGSDTVVSYEPIGPEDEGAAQQATDYVNMIVIPESDAERAIYDAIQDAMLLKTGILKWCAYTTKKVEFEEYTDQDDNAILGLTEVPGVEVLDLESEPETDPAVLELDPNAKRHSFRLKYFSEKTDIKLEAVPRGSFLISPEAESIDAAELVGEEQIVTRSQLVSWGYDRDLAEALTTHHAPEEDEESRKGDDWTDERSESLKAQQEVLIWEVYVRLDTDDDGIAELHRIVFGEGKGDQGGEDGKYVLLGQETVSEAPYGEVVIERDAHEFEGHSLYEDIRDVQRVKTAVLRAVLDNTYAMNNPRPGVDTGALTHPEDAMDWVPGKPIRFKSGTNLMQALQWAQVPSIAASAFPVMEYMDLIAKERTGITDASGGLGPEALTNTSATSAMIASESGIAQTDAIVRTVAACLRKPFRGLLRLVVAHADKPRTIKLKGEWIDYDPRSWNASMDCTVNVGLGGGTKERDVNILRMILQEQKEIMMTAGPSNPMVSPSQLYNTYAKLIEASGMSNVDPYFTEPDPEQVKAMLDQQAQKPSPEETKMQGKMQVEQMRMQANRDKEMAQMEADLQVEQMRIAASTQDNAEKWAIEREKLAQQRQKHLETLQQQREIEFSRMRMTIAQKMQRPEAPQ